MHPHSSWMIALAGTVALAAATCTQSYDDFAFDGATTPTGTGTAAAGGTAPGGSGGQTTTGGSGGQTTTGGSGGQTTTGGSGGQTTAGGAGGGGTGGIGGTGGQPPTYEVACDQTPCDVSSGGYCCLPHDDPPNSPSCESSGTSCDEQDYTTVTCDGPEDCPGQLCCGTRQMLTYITVECADSCDGYNQSIVCDPNGPDQCEPQDDCLQSGYLPDGYFVCR